MGLFEAIGADADDPPDIQIKKRSMVALAVLVGVLGTVWGVMYFAAGEPVAASIPLIYSMLSAVSIAVFSVTKKYVLFRASQLTLVLLLPFLLMLALGGFVNSSAVVLWSLLAPLGALLMAGRRPAIPWFIAYAALVVLSGLIQPFVRETNNLSTGLVTLFFAMNLMAVPLVAFVLLQYFVGQRDRAMELLDVEREKSERLLLNVLPATIADMLKEEPKTIAHHHAEASVLFADVVGFTPLSNELTPDEMVDLLNEVFTYFDALCDRHGVEKIRTIGDNYMVAAGVPVERPDHARAITTVAVAMNAFTATSTSPRRPHLRFRFGINSGPLIAGVIGDTKFQYDIWGDTVNTASRMESHGVPGKIQVTEATYRLIADDFVCEPRGSIEVKGKGPMRTWFVEGVRSG
jgi:guanylate cyclase